MEQWPAPAWRLAAASRRLLPWTQVQSGCSCWTAKTTAAVATQGCGAAELFEAHCCRDAAALGTWIQSLLPATLPQVDTWPQHRAQPQLLTPGTHRQLRKTWAGGTWPAWRRDFRDAQTRQRPSACLSSSLSRTHVSCHWSNSCCWPRLCCLRAALMAMRASCGLCCTPSLAATAMTGTLRSALRPSLPCSRLQPRWWLHAQQARCK